MLLYFYYVFTTCKYRCAAGWTTEFQFPAETLIGFFLFATVSRQAMGPTSQPPIRWVPAFFPRRKSGRSVKLTSHDHLVQGLRIGGAIPPFTQYIFKTWCLI